MSFTEEKTMKVLRSRELWAALSIIIAAVVLMVADTLQRINFGFFVELFRGAFPWGFSVLITGLC